MSFHRNDPMGRIKFNFPTYWIFSINIIIVFINLWQGHSAHDFRITLYSHSIHCKPGVITTELSRMEEYSNPSQQKVLFPYTTHCLFR